MCFFFFKMSILLNPMKFKSILRKRTSTLPRRNSGSIKATGGFGLLSTSSPPSSTSPNPRCHALPWCGNYSMTLAFHGNNPLSVQPVQLDIPRLDRLQPAYLLGLSNLSNLSWILISYRFFFLHIFSFLSIELLVRKSPSKLDKP